MNGIEILICNGQKFYKTMMGERLADPYVQAFAPQKEQAKTSLVLQ